MSWYATGYDDSKREEERQASSQTPNRFWMKAGTSRSVVWLDDEPFCIYEHQYVQDGKWNNFLTCNKGMKGAETVCCDKIGNATRQYIAYYTVVDCSEWSDKNGNSHQYEIKLYPAKLRVLKKIKRKKEQKTTLVGCMYQITREDGRSPSVGDDFEFQKEVDLSKLLEFVTYRGKKLSELYGKAETDPVQLARLAKTFAFRRDKDDAPIFDNTLLPFNYRSVLEPKSADGMRDLLQGVRREDQGRPFDAGKPGGARADDNVPF